MRLTMTVEGTTFEGEGTPEEWAELRRQMAGRNGATKIVDVPKRRERSGQTTARDKAIEALKLLAKADGWVGSDYMVKELELTTASDTGNIIKGSKLLSDEFRIPMDEFLVLSHKRPRKYKKGHRLGELLSKLGIKPEEGE